MDSKECSCCHRVLPLSEFNKNKNSNDGLQDKCRHCFSEYNKKRYAARREKFKSDVKKYREENPRALFNTRLKTCSKNPSRMRACRVIEAALNAGIIERPHRCFGCGCSDQEHRIEAHHHDYSKPLDVIWLCTPCHRRMDARRRIQEGKTPYGVKK